LQVKSAADEACVISITNDLYRPLQPAESAITSRTMQRTAGAAETAAAKAAAASVSATAAIGPTAKAGVSVKVGGPSVTGLVGLHKVWICLGCLIKV